jgi:hypothetical protein
MMWDAEGETAVRILPIIASAILVTSRAAAAAPEHSTPPPPIKAAPALKGGVPNFDAMIGIFDKLFPALPDPDPARLALARTAVAAMWPDGAYGKMMSGLLSGTIDRAMQLKSSDFAAMGGKTAKAETAASPADLSLHDQIGRKDPYFDRRMAAYRQVIDEETGKLSTVIDPRMRDGLARSMARTFDARQLADIDAFFATPSGHALASHYMQLWVEPDTMRSMFTAMPEMIKLMPDVMQKMKAIDAKYPKPKEPAKAEPKS